MTSENFWKSSKNATTGKLQLVHNAYKVELKGESMRKKRTMLDQKAELVPDSQHKPVK
jgi:hypothetical protein